LPIAPRLGFADGQANGMTQKTQKFADARRTPLRPGEPRPPSQPLAPAGEAFMVSVGFCARLRHLRLLRQMPFARLGDPTESTAGGVPTGSSRDEVQEAGGIFCV
jgi:hypothetical protein